MARINMYGSMMVAMVIIAIMMPSSIHGSWLDDQVESLDELYTVVARTVPRLEASRAANTFPAVDEYRFAEARMDGDGDGSDGAGSAAGGGGEAEGGGAAKKGKKPKVPSTAALKGKEKPAPKFPLPPPVPPGQGVRFPGYPYPYVRPSRDYLNKLGKEQYLNMWRATAWQGPYDPTATYPTTTPNYYAPVSDPYARGRDITAPHVRYQKVQEQLMDRMNPILSNAPPLRATVPPNFQLPNVPIPGQQKVVSSVHGVVHAPVMNPYMYTLRGPPPTWPHRSVPDWSPWFPTENMATTAVDPSITPSATYYGYTNNGGTPFIPTSYPYTAYYGAAPQSYTVKAAP